MQVHVRCSYEFAFLQFRCPTLPYRLVNCPSIKKFKSSSMFHLSY